MPDAALLYYLMFRGSVTPKTMRLCIETVRNGIPITDMVRWSKAKDLTDKLWDDWALTSDPESV